MKDDQVLKDAQYRKGLSIAFFNATNAAVELIKGMAFENEGARRAKLVEIRDWLLGEHQTYYANVLSAVGSNYKAGEAIEKMRAATDIEGLSLVWRLLSEDERHDPEIIKVAKELKAKLSAPADEGAQPEAPADVPTVQVGEEAPAAAEVAPEAPKAASEAPAPVQATLDGGETATPQPIKKGGKKHEKA